MTTKICRILAPRRLARLLLGAALLTPLATPATAAGRLDGSLLGLPSGPWPLAHHSPRGVETYLIPSQLGAVHRLPDAERRDVLRFIRAHDANLSFLRQTSRHFFSRVNAAHLHAVPEYAMDLGEAMMGIDPENAHDDNPLHAHEPLLQALPPYTRIILLAPATAVPRVRTRLARLGLSSRVRLVASQTAAQPSPDGGATHWVRDLGFVARDDRRAVLLASLAHKNFADVAHNDLAYLGQIGDRTHQLLRLPVFLRGGNLAVARAEQTILLVGNEELRMNQQWFAEAFGFSLPPTALPDILKAASGSERVVILPNSRNLYHLDMFIAPLGDGTVGLLTPDDPEHLAAVDRDTLSAARDALRSLGMQIVPIPTSSERMARFQSSTNIVSFTDRASGRHRALVPMFPEPPGLPPAHSLNARVLAAYRAAGIDPIPVEDRFHRRWGNTHCALLPLH